MSDLLQQRQRDIAEEFEFFEDWMERYEHIIELGKELDPIPESDKLDEHLIRGCQSRVWLLAAKDGEGNVRFRADSDAIITKGCLLYTSPSPRDLSTSRMPSSA